MQATSDDVPISRIAQGVLICATLGTSWLAMQIVHEAGHVAAAWASGGQVQRVVLDPLQISRTDVAPNPLPLFVVWAGPLLGIILPCAAWRIARRVAGRLEYLFRFFAGFCLIANGSYLGAGVVLPVGDAADILRLGGSRWSLAVFGLLSVPAGLRLWHGQGPSFGLGDNRMPIRSTHAWGMVILLIALVAGELLWN
jgi:hypothetical protein